MMQKKLVLLPKKIISLFNVFKIYIMQNLNQNVKKI
jgi:hypothetical protein